MAEILAVLIFLGMFTAIIMGRVHRYIPAIIGGGLTLLVVFLIAMRDPAGAFKVLNLSQLVDFGFWWPGEQHVESHGINWQTVIFIGGMMVMVEGLGGVGFFRWLCLFLARLVRFRIMPLLVAFMLLSAALSMFIDSITVLLFLASVTIELARLLKFDPVPVIVAEIFAANVGGSATMCGDPPNIIIGTALGYTFTDFALNTGPIAWTAMVITVMYFVLRLRGGLKSEGASSVTTKRNVPSPREAVTSWPLFYANTVVFLIVVVLLITHAQTGMSVAFIGVVAAFLTLLTGIKEAKHIISRVDWRTLVFFIGLFMCVGGLEGTGFLKRIADYIGSIAGGDLVIMIALILWLSAIASAIVDNIPFAATMVPVINSLASTTGVPLPTLAWTLALGTDIGGNATPIGASANVVGTAIAEREGYPVRWGRFLKYALPATVMVIALCHVMLVWIYT